MWIYCSGKYWKVSTEISNSEFYEGVQRSAIFWHVWVCSTYHATNAVLIMMVGALIRCTLLHSMYNLKAAQMNVQYSLIQELMLYKFEPNHNIMEVTKNICVNGEDDHRTVTRWFKKFCSDCKNLNSQVGLKSWIPKGCTPSYRGKSGGWHVESIR